MRTKILNELRASYEPYSLQWREWTSYSHCGFNQEEIEVMNLFIASNFEVSIQDFIHFYNNLEVIKRLIEKFKSNYSDFQEWVVSRFLHHVLNIAKQENLVTFLETPINELAVSEALKDTLNQFNLKTFNEIVKTYSDKDFTESKSFKNILAFQSNLKSQTVSPV